MDCCLQRRHLLSLLLIVHCRAKDDALKGRQVERRNIRQVVERLRTRRDRDVGQQLMVVGTEEKVVVVIALLLLLLCRGG